MFLYIKKFTFTYTGTPNRSLSVHFTMNLQAQDFNTNMLTLIHEKSYFKNLRHPSLINDFAGYLNPRVMGHHLHLVDKQFGAHIKKMCSRPRHTNTQSLYCRFVYRSQFSPRTQRSRAELKAAQK